MGLYYNEVTVLIHPMVILALIELIKLAVKVYGHNKKKKKSKK